MERAAIIRQAPDTVYSFAGGARYPAPDVARGGMLLLIACANVAYWLRMFPASAAKSPLDEAWVFLRALFVDQRAFPLFAMLFGFGLMTMVRRVSRRHVHQRVAELDSMPLELTHEDREGWLEQFRGEARAIARRLVRRRGLWMLLFGFCHAMLFYGDIMGTYALIAIVFAGVFAQQRWRVMIVVGALAFGVQLVGNVGYHWAIQSGQAPYYADVNTHSLVTPWFPMASLGIWAMATTASVLLSTVLPCVFVGSWLATTELITRPDKHRRTLQLAAVLGLGFGALTALPKALGVHGVWVPVLGSLGGPVGAFGWLAALALAAGPAGVGLHGWRGVMSAVGHRSMTAYVGQSVGFVILGALGLAGVQAVPEIVGLITAVVVWALTVWLCVTLERRGYPRGPLELLLRRAVANSAKPRPVVSISPTLVSQNDDPRRDPPIIGQSRTANQTVLEGQRTGGTSLGRQVRWSWP